MKVKGIICELNPFHEGHRYLVRRAMEGEDVESTCLVAAMSGPFVQRGSPAILDKWTRARIAILEGFDLVLEIPAAYVLQSAHSFAYGGIKTLSLLSAFDSLVFGVEETFFTEKFRKGLSRLEDKEIQDKIRKDLHGGLSYRRAISRILDIDLEPNTILAMEYIALAKKLSLPIQFEAIIRQGMGYHQMKMEGAYPSASAIRQALFEGRINKWNLLNGQEIHRDDFTESLNPLGSYLKLREILDPIDFSPSPLFETGMDFRLKSCLKEASGVDRALLKAANKRQSVSRYRRMLVTGLLDLKKGKIPPISFLRPLAFNEKGRRLLRSPSCPVIQKLPSAGLDGSEKDLMTVNLKAQALQEYLLGLPPKMDYHQSFFISTSH